MKINGKTVGPAKAVMTPYAMALMSEDLFQASENYRPERFPLINYFLYAASIEVGLKAAILSLDCTKESKEKIKRLGHNLEKILITFETEVTKDFFSRKEKDTLSKLNTHYRNKGLEYFTLPVLASSLRGFKDFPEIKDVKGIAKRTVALVVANKYYIEAQTSDEAGNGLINFY